MHTYIERELKTEILKKLVIGQVVVLYGARRVGKTTLINDISKKLKGKIKFINAENSIQQNEINTENFYKLQNVLKNYAYLIIDEAQKIPNIGQILKIIVDNVKDIKILVSGSASFELANQVGEPLTGRKRTLTLYPISVSELFEEDESAINEQLEDRLIYGSYPKIHLISDNHERKEELHEIVDSYLYKDILELEDVRNSAKLKDLLVLLALQVGAEVSLNELANNLNVHINTVSRYLDLLEKVFVIYRLSAFSRNLRKEISKNNKYYFFDNGIRNTLINNFNHLSLRDDRGKLWENFLMSERIKLLNNRREFVNKYFWRTYDQKEIDLIEEKEGKLYAYEFKYKDKKFKLPDEFLKTYAGSSFKLINTENYIKFVTEI